MAYSTRPAEARAYITDPYAIRCPRCGAIIPRQSMGGGGWSLLPCDNSKPHPGGRMLFVVERMRRAFVVPVDGNACDQLRGIWNAGGEPTVADAIALMHRDRAA